MSYINDPRENIQNPETGYVLESENRKEEMYKWSGKILDLCDLPVEEYMKPMTVIALGGGVLPDTGETMYTLKFVIDGVVVGQEKLISGDPIIFNIDAVKEDRNFLGWYYGGTKYEEGALMPSKNLTLTAKYECDVKFIFIVDGIEEEISAYTVDYNTTLNKIPSVNMPGFEFKGWEPSINNPVTSHTVYYATFESIVYVVTWNGYVDGPIIQEYKYNDTLIQPINPEKEGYKFINWNEVIPEKVTSNLVFTAKFEVNQYQVSYYEKFDGNKFLLSAFTMDYGTIISKPVLPFENGYTHTKWEGEYTGTTVPAFDIEFITEKTINSYTLSYFVNGIGNNEAVKTIVYEYMAPIDAYVFEKEGYYPVTEWEGLPTHMPYNDLKVYGKTEIMKFTVKFIDEEGILIKEETGVTYGTIVETILPTDTVEYDYTFNESDLAIAVKEDLTINVTKIKKQYEVTVVINGIEEKVSLEYGVNINEYVENTYIPEEGYHREFTTTHETVPGNNNARVEIVYKPNILILSYATIGAGEKDINGEVEVAFNDTILDKLPKGIIEGYNFSGWFNGENKVTELDVMPNNDVTVNGTYEVIMLHVNVLDGDTIVLSKDYAYGTSVSEVINDNIVIAYISELDKNGYVGTLNLNGVEVIKSDLDFQIERTEKEYVLTFMNGETLISSALAKFNSIIEYPEMSGYTTENGVEYVFTWNDNSYNGKPMPAMNVTIIGSYKEKPVAPIYYGSFVVPVSAYSEENISKYYVESDLSTVYYDSVSVSECEGNGKQIIVFMPGYEPLSGLTDKNANREATKYYEPPVFIIPISIVDTYNISILDGAGIDNWERYATDNNAININGSDYYFYSHIVNDSLTPYKYDNSDLKVTLKLTKK